ncbi:retrovirus-related Pol polyprotein from transposon 17.6 isoform X1 [Temnothorax longispinosus]|uniref:retrovirus-related Pol polyprotein from transposon 17.6 isoform X1 n=1 Tax=Temnothorax longispinosus TaxID=300112 RepID=UPI003A991166
MATAAVPNTFTIEPFDSTTTNWSRWLLRLEGAFRIFTIKDEARVPYLLHYVGATSFDILCDRLSPQDPFEASYDTLTRSLRDFYDPAPLEIAENFKFHQRKQKDGETVQEFLAALHKLSVHCKFGDYLKTALRNQLVFGLSNKRIQARLLELADLTLEKAAQVATTMELSEKGAQQLQGGAADLSLVQAVKRTPRYSLNVDKSLKVTSKGTNARKPSGKQASQNVKKPTNSNTNAITCYRCGSNHLASKCTLDKNVKCNACGKSGHLKKVCFQRDRETNQLEEILQLEHTQFRDKISTTLLVNGKQVKFEIDSGAAVSVMAQEHVSKLFPNSPIQQTQLKLVSYCKQNVKLLGYIVVTVRCRNKLYKLNLYVTNEKRNALLGREWIFQLQDENNIKEFISSVNSIHTIDTSYKNRLDALLQKYQSIMTSSISKIKGIQAKLTLKKNAKPIFCKSRPVPFKLRPLIEKELQRLESEGVLVKVDTSEWATPIVPVLKKDGQIRICGDYSVTLNPQLVVDDHPLPTADELFVSMAGGTVFSKIDLRQAYLQMEVSPEDQHLLTLNTHKGLYRSTRLMYGGASAPAIWQQKIEYILKDLLGIAVFLDDIRIAGKNPEDHLQKLEAVFKRLQQYNIRINLDKSEFFMKQINYCGYIIDKNGLHKEPNKVEAIKKMRRPENVTEVRSFLGMINYYGRFIKNLSVILHPLNNLLRKNTKFIWTTDCEKSFIAAKKAFSSTNFLVHFDPTLPLILATEASAYGVGAILSHLYPDGTERVIQYASQTLSKTQRSYSQIDKEAYAIIFGIKKFYQFLHGGHFTLITDHRPLVQIFSPQKGLPICSAMRMQHYALFLRGFNYSIKYRKSEAHANADCLSRLPIKENQVKCK